MSSARPSCGVGQLPQSAARDARGLTFVESSVAAQMVAVDALRIPGKNSPSLHASAERSPNPSERRIQATRLLELDGSSRFGALTRGARSSVFSQTDCSNLTCSLRRVATSKALPPAWHRSCSNVANKSATFWGL